MKYVDMQFHLKNRFPSLNLAIKQKIQNISHNIDGKNLS